MRNKHSLCLLLPILVFSCISCSGTEKKQEGVTDGKLDAPVLSIDGNNVTWKLNKFADYYAVFINGEFVSTTKNNSYLLEDRINGEYVTTVQSLNSLKTYIDSNLSQPISYVVSKKELKAPEVIVDGNIIHWSDVEGASSYRVYENKQWKNTWTIENHDGVNYCQLYIEKSGSYTFDVKALSDDLTYEREKTTVIKDFEIDLNKAWTIKQFLNEWVSYGDISSNENGVAFNNNHLEPLSGIKNRILIDKNNNYLYLSFHNDVSTIKSSIKVYVDDTLVKEVDSQERPSSISPNTLMYDFEQFIDQLVNIKIEVNDYQKAILNHAQLLTGNNVSNLQKWNLNDLDREWLSYGDSQLHDEGFCLECIDGQKPYMTNRIKINEDTTLNMYLRKFVRMQVQDPDPIIYLYANDTLIRPIGSSTDYATATGDIPVSICYDLSSFKGQDINIKIVAFAGRHCVIPQIKMIND